MGLALVVLLALVRPPAAQPELPTLSARPLMEPGDLLARFDGPARTTRNGAQVALEPLEAGRLRLPTGRVALADAFFFGIDDNTLDRGVARGSAPVTALMATGEDSAPVLAAAVLRFSSASVARWEGIRGAAGSVAYAGTESGIVGIACDGLQAGHWGLDATGKPAVLLLDFGVLDATGGG